MPDTHHPHASLPIDLLHKASLIEQQWSPRVVAEMNDYQFKVVRIEGEFIWHSPLRLTRRFLCWKASCASIWRKAVCM